MVERENITCIGSKIAKMINKWIKIETTGEHGEILVLYINFR